MNKEQYCGITDLLNYSFYPYRNHTPFFFTDKKKSLDEHNYTLFPSYLKDRKLEVKKLLDNELWIYILDRILTFHSAYDISNFTLSKNGGYYLLNQIKENINTTLKEFINLTEFQAIEKVLKLEYGKNFNLNKYKSVSIKTISIDTNHYSWLPNQTSSPFDQIKSSINNKYLKVKDFSFYKNYPLPMFVATHTSSDWGHYGEQLEKLNHYYSLVDGSCRIKAFLEFNNDKEIKFIAVEV